MINEITIIKITNTNIFKLNKLLTDSLKDKSSIISTVIQEWFSRKNMFDKPGESLWGISINDEIVAICGVNIDPYLNDKYIGRIRRLYVSSNYRYMGIATKLLRHILAFCRNYYVTLRIETYSNSISKLCLSIGGSKIVDPHATHVLHLNSIPDRFFDSHSDKF